MVRRLKWDWEGFDHKQSWQIVKCSKYHLLTCDPLYHSLSAMLLTLAFVCHNLFGWHIFLIEVFDVFLSPTSKPARENICFTVRANLMCYHLLVILQNLDPTCPLNGLQGSEGEWRTGVRNIGLSESQIRRTLL